MTSSDDLVERDKGGRFIVPPKSPGRPRGPSAAEQIRALLVPHQPELVAKAVELGRLGDPVALRLCLERLAPAPRPEAEKFVVPGLKEANGFAAKCEAILAAVADGVISSEAAERALRMLDVYRKAHETDVLAARIEALERGAKAAVVDVTPPSAEDIV